MNPIDRQIVEEQTLAQIVGGALDEMRGIRDTLLRENAEANKSLVAIVANYRDDATATSTSLLVQIMEVKETIRANAEQTQHWRTSEAHARASGQAFYRIIAWAFLVLALAWLLFGIAAIVIATKQIIRFG